MSNSLGYSSESFDFTCRAGTLEDAGRLAALVQGYYNWINVNHSPFSVVHRRMTEESMRQSMEGQPCVVAEVDGVVIGFAVTRPQEPSLMEIRNVYVDDPYRNHGIARAMIALLEEQVSRLGYTMMMATSSAIYYPNKPMPTRMFIDCGYEVTKLDTNTELYLRHLPEPDDASEDEVPIIRHIAYREKFEKDF